MSFKATITPKNENEKNRSLVEMTRWLLNDANLEKHFWGEAIVVANYLMNRLPTNALPEQKTPFELWHGIRPDLSGLRVFGCRAWVQIPSVKRGKLDGAAKSMIFIGYPDFPKISPYSVLRLMKGFPQVNSIATF